MMVYNYQTLCYFIVIFNRNLWAYLMYTQDTDLPLVSVGILHGSHSLEKSLDFSGSLGKSLRFKNP